MLKSLFTFVILASALLITNALAAELRDPTQLPEDFLLSNAHENTDIGESGRSPSGPVLQSVMLSDSVRAAIINGKKINIGEVYQSSTLVALTENSATLQDSSGNKKILKMPHLGIKQHKKTMPSSQLMATKANQHR